ncbi:MAG: hypothetical protein OXI38_14635 [Bacteroidota bacterium]|nr:hypothetical protein [Bacteroidota bacterium]
MRYLLLSLTLLLGVAIDTSAQNLRRAERALRSGELSEAMAQANGVLESDPDDHRVHDVLARIHEAMAAGTPPAEYVGHIREMKSAYDRVIELRPREEQKINLLMINKWVTEFNAGIAEFNSARAAAADSAEWYYLMSAAHFEASSIAQPDSADSYVNWAYALMGAGDDVGAVDPLTKSLVLGGPDADSYSLLARIMLTNDRAEEAVPLLERALFTDSLEAPDLQDFLLNAYAQTGNAERALATYENAVMGSPDNQIYRYNYGSLLLQAERYDEAIAQLIVAVGIDGGYTDALYNLGAAYINKANDLQQDINEKDDALRAARNDLTEEEVTTQTEELDGMIATRVALYEQAQEPLEQARQVAQNEEADNLEQICFALYQVYAQTNQMEKVEEIQACAGMSESN